MVDLQIDSSRQINLNRLYCRPVKSYLTGVLDHANSGGIQTDVKSVQDVDHKLPHGLKLMRPNTARAVNKEDQVHWTGLTLVFGTWKEMRSLLNECFQSHLGILHDLYVQTNTFKYICTPGKL